MSGYSSQVRKYCEGAEVPKQIEVYFYDSFVNQGLWGICPLHPGSVSAVAGVFRPTARAGIPVGEPLAAVLVCLHSELLYSIFCAPLIGSRKLQFGSESEHDNWVRLCCSFSSLQFETLVESGLYISAGSLGEAGGSFPVIYFKVM